MRRFFVIDLGHSPNRLRSADGSHSAVRIENRQCRKVVPGQLFRWRFLEVTFLGVGWREGGFREREGEGSALPPAFSAPEPAALAVSLRCPFLSGSGNWNINPTN
jgi:hypothetical protein